jgi:hypothetical protein
MAVSTRKVKTVEIKNSSANTAVYEVDISESPGIEILR